ncbi:uncharacterized protein TNCV_1381131 [Trichonephila clavipes]|nr:uncharacterized protein TNCV_1381131 [Trichonephila clavipes]
MGKYVFSTSQVLSTLSSDAPLMPGLNGFGSTFKSGLGPLESCTPPVISGCTLHHSEIQTLQDALFTCYKQSPDNVHSVPFSKRSSSPRLIEDETFNDSDIINNLIDYEDGQEEPDSLRVDKNM